MAGEEVRPEKVALGRKLIADPAYPGPRVVRAVAKALVKKFSASAKP